MENSHVHMYSNPIFGHIMGCEIRQADCSLLSSYPNTVSSYSSQFKVHLHGERVGSGMILFNRFVNYIIYRRGKIIFVYSWMAKYLPSQLKLRVNLENNQAIKNNKILIINELEISE